MHFPAPPSLESYLPDLSKMVAATSWLPNRRVVAAFDGAVFPTARYKRDHERLSLIGERREVVGMYDDNATPEWAIRWSHGMTGSRPKGWTVAHVWPESDRHSYTHLANLALVPEPFATLTDKDGPLTAFLRWHAWHVYRWKPTREPRPTKPRGYDAIKWMYLEAGADDPRGAVRKMMAERRNQRVETLRPIMARGARRAREAH